MQTLTHKLTLLQGRVSANEFLNSSFGSGDHNELILAQAHKGEQMNICARTQTHTHTHACADTH